ncbi:MAG: type II toxin-antitoxin system VapC family toxin [Hyphomicrobiaceae bacterium]
MKVLLDTHLLLWAAGNPMRLAPATRALIEADDTELLFSAASVWEIGIKNAMGRDDFRIDPRAFRAALLGNDYTELSITGEHALAASALPTIHRDPFDRMLVAQASIEGATLLTADPLVGRYPGTIRLEGS